LSQLVQVLGSGLPHLVILQAGDEVLGFLELGDIYLPKMFCGEVDISDQRRGESLRDQLILGIEFVSPAEVEQGGAVEQGEQSVRQRHVVVCGPLLQGRLHQLVPEWIGQRV